MAVAEKTVTCWVPFDASAKFREGFGDFRKKADAIFLHQLFEKGFSDGRTPQTRTEFYKDGNFVFSAKHRRGHDMAQFDRILDRLPQPR